jgi:hypothetical protein
MALFEVSLPPTSNKELKNLVGEGHLFNDQHCILYPHIEIEFRDT